MLLMQYNTFKCGVFSRKIKEMNIHKQKQVKNTKIRQQVLLTSSQPTAEKSCQCPQLFYEFKESAIQGLVRESNRK